MTDQQPAAQTAAERFLQMITAGRRDRSRPVVEDDAYLAMMWRQARALEARACNNPEMFPQILALVQRLREVVDVAISVNADRYAIDPRMGASAGECATVLGMAKQSASERRVRGRAVIERRLAAAGAVPFAEAKREAAARREAAEHAVTNLAEYRGRHHRRTA